MQGLSNLQSRNSSKSLPSCLDQLGIKDLWRNGTIFLRFSLLGIPQKSFPSIYSWFFWSRVTLSAQRNSMAPPPQESLKAWGPLALQGCEKCKAEPQGGFCLLPFSLNYHISPGFQHQWCSPMSCRESGGIGPDALHESYPSGILTNSAGYRLFITKNWDYPLLRLLSPILQNDFWEFFLTWVYFISEQNV